MPVDFKVYCEIVRGQDRSLLMHSLNIPWRSRYDDPFFMWLYLGKIDTSTVNIFDTTLTPKLENSRLANVYDSEGLSSLADTLKRAESTRACRVGHNTAEHVMRLTGLGCPTAIPKKIITGFDWNFDVWYDTLLSSEDLYWLKFGRTPGKLFCTDGQRARFRIPFMERYPGYIDEINMLSGICDDFNLLCYKSRY